MSTPNQRLLRTLAVPFVLSCFGGCATAVSPPTQTAATHYCLNSAQEADARAIRYRSLGLGSAATSAVLLAATPISAARTNDRDRGALVGSALATSAIAAAFLAKRWLDRGNHESAIATSFADCISPSDPRAAFAHARATYQLWIRPDLDRAELVRQSVRSANRPFGPPPPPPWSDDSRRPDPPDESGDRDVLHVQLSPPSKGI